MYQYAIIVQIDTAVEFENIRSRHSPFESKIGAIRRCALRRWALDSKRGGALPVARGWVTNSCCFCNICQLVEGH